MNTLTLSPPRTRKGFGLLEMILVFAIVIIASAVGFSVYESAKPSANAANDAKILVMIAANTRALYVSQHDYAGLKPWVAVAGKVYPPSLLDSPGLPLPKLRGNLIYDTAWPDIHHFDIHLDGGISQAECDKLVSDLSPNFDDIIVAGGGTASGLTGGSVFTNGKLDQTKLAYWCSGAGGGTTIGLDLIGH